ncbi:MAG: coenzyme hydrogenase beta [Geobacteraceae bacterium]|nr:MAG: coenzyme hydrogenase beta [Geobacteraceae bacterium]
MTRADWATLEQDVLRAGLCCRCGTCSAVCPVASITIEPDSLKPTAVADCPCSRCGRCVAVCPGYSTPQATLYGRLFGRLPRHDEPYGITRRFLVGRTTDETIYRQSAGGGLVTQLLVNLLNEGVIDGAVVAGYRTDRPYVPEGKVVSIKEDLVHCANSIYVCVPVNQVLREVASTGRRVAVVGLPCAIAALRKAQQHTPHLTKNIVVLIGIFCGINIGQEATLFYLKSKGIQPHDVTSYSTRTKADGYGIKVGLRSGNLLHKKNVAVHLGLAPIFTPLRCHMCPDLINEFADIAVGDTWLHDGNSVLLVRTEAGENALRPATDMTLEPVSDFVTHRNGIINKKIKSQYLIELTHGKRRRATEFEMTDELRCGYDWNERDRRVFAAVHRLFSIPVVRKTAKHLLVGDRYLSLPVDRSYLPAKVLIAGYTLPLWHEPLASQIQRKAQ